MPSNPAISIVVPVYNQQRYLVECLDSLRDQTFADIEVVCVDDGSTDGSPALLDGYTGLGARLRVVHQRNAGVAAARNRGLDEARGTYVMFVDSDDFIRTDTCELLHNVAREQDADIVVFGGKTFPESNWADDCFAKRRVTYKGESLKAVFLEPGSNPLMCNKMYRRSMLDDAGLRFDPALRLGEDNAFQFATFPHARTVAYTPETLYFYRSHAESAVQAIKDDSDKRVLEHLKVVRSVVDLWREKRYIVGHEFDLLNWAVEFLNRDARFTTFAPRQELSEGFCALYERTFDAATADALTKTRRRQLDFILGARHAAQDDPAVSVVLCAEPGRAFDEDAFHSLELQTEQRVEFVVVENGTAWLEEGRPVLARDPRCRFSPSLEEAVASARAPWVLLPSTSAEYVPTALEQLLRDVEELPRSAEPFPLSNAAVDAVTFTDADGLLESADPYACITVTSATNLDGRRAFAARELAGGAFHMASLASGNKLLAAGLVKAEERDGRHVSSLALAQGALCRAAAVLPTKVPLVTVRKAKLASDGAQALLASMDASVATLRARTAPELLGALDSSYAALLVSLMGTTRSLDAFCQLFPLVRERLAANPDALDDPLLAPAFADEARRLCDAASEHDYFPEHVLEQLHKLGIENGKNLRQVGEVASEVALLHEDIDRFYSSVTYRAGRIATALPRKIVNLIRRKG